MTTRSKLETASRVLAALTLAVGVLLAGPVATALAHASLVSSDPAEGSSVQQSPATVVLTFGENPDPNRSLVRILDEHGRTVPGVSPMETIPGKPLELQVALSGSLGTGVYSVNWRSVSAVDGHVANGAFAFGVGVTPASGSLKTVDLLYTSPWTSTLSAVGRWLLYAGLALFVGAAATCLLALGGRVPAGGASLLRVAAAAVIVGLCAMVWAERALVGAASLLPLFETREGQYLLALGVALAVCVGAVVCVDLWPARWSLVVLGAAGAVAMLVHVLAGHADAPSSWRIVNVALQWVHMTSIGVWVGGLAWLLLGIRAMTKSDRATAVGAFSRVATVTLVVVLVTGVTRGLVEVGSLGNLFTTAYGITLLVKMGLVVFLVVLGALNHFKWVPSLRRDDGSVRTFRMNSRGELAVAAVVLAVTAVLSGMVPASSAVASGVASAASRATLSSRDQAPALHGVSLRPASAAKPGFTVSGTTSPRTTILLLGDVSDGSSRAAR
jgi:copper transport protein